mgnify:CR=1 FL=1
MTTNARLAQALEAANAPKAMVTAARAGCYGDFTTESATPIMDLVRDAQRAGLPAIARRAMDGEFDATREESEAWAAGQTGEMGRMIRQLRPAKKP